MAPADVIDFPCRAEGRGKFVSLYSGAGGLDLGFVRAGFEPLWANDFETDAVATYNDVFARLGFEHRAVDGDISAHIKEGRVPTEGTADLVIGGPPCQGFSVAGKMDPDDPRSKHVSTFLDVVERIQPRAFVMENVSALAWNERWSGVIEALRWRAEHELRYTTSVVVLNASDYGVAQNRRRMFFVGVRDADFIEPAKTTPTNPQTVRSVLMQLPPPGTPGNATLCRARITPARTPVLRRSPYAGMLFNGKGRPLNLDAPAATLPASMGGNKTPIIDQEQLDRDVEPWIVDYHRHLTRGGRPASVVPGRLRRLTVEEAAAIQSFPFGMTWHGAINKQFAQIGNAVPPKLAFHVARAIRRSLETSAAASLPEQLSA